MPNETPPKDRPKDFKEFRMMDLFDKGYDIKERPQDYHYIEYQNPVTKKMDRDFYHIPTLKRVGELAVQRKMDPWTAMQIAASESHGGIWSTRNPMHYSGMKDTDNPALDREAEGALSREDILTGMVEPENRNKVQGIWDMAAPRFEDVRRMKGEYIQDTYINASLDELERVQKKYGNTQTAIQAYSGTGKRPTQSYADHVLGGNKAFGQSLNKIDMWRDQPQAKRVKALEPHIKAIPALREAFPVE